MSKLPRVAALVGPFASGKTSLLESLLLATNAITRKGSVKEGNAVGDSSPEARARMMSVELTVASTFYLDDPWTFIDCPGSVEFMQDTLNTLMVADAAVVVVEPDPARAVMAAPLLKFLDDHGVPHIIFINKCEAGDVRLSETMEAFQAVSDRPLVLRELPLRDKGELVGFVDLVSERAWRYRAGQPSEMVRMPDSAKPIEESARQEMLEHLADLDDHLLEELLEEVPPPTDEVYDNLAKDLAADLIVPVFFGSATADHGITRLLKALRHEVPEPRQTARRQGIEADGGPVARVFKTVHAQHTGKMSLARVWRGSFAENSVSDGRKIAGLFGPQGATMTKVQSAQAGDVVGFARLDDMATGGMLGDAQESWAPWPQPLPRLFSLSLQAVRKGDDVKLSGALTKLSEEDPSLTLEHSAETGEMILWGQGDIHLQVAIERLKNRFNVEVTTQRPQVPYRETIRKAATVHGRHKRQTGGHGQFGDVHIDIAPLPRGEGFAFHDKIVGGVVPRQYIPSVEEGAREFLAQGALGFPVVDLAVTLTNGSYHAVDSSDMAFKTAARIAMAEGLPKCEPVLLEPIIQVEVSVPNEYTSKAQRVISGRRGQILGYEAKENWKGWDSVSAWLPQAEMHDLIIELRSLTMGVGTFSWRFDHLQEFTGKSAEKVVEARKAALDG
ncbi:MAG: elongation factor G [Alphaproteobacteria bacterium]|nr:elongation factor G [Alphaproteobacteria bacterium]